MTKIDLLDKNWGLRLGFIKAVTANNITGQDVDPKDPLSKAVHNGEEVLLLLLVLVLARDSLPTDLQGAKSRS